MLFEPSQPFYDHKALMFGMSPIWNSQINIKTLLIDQGYIYGLLMQIRINYSIYILISR
ncbi:hypothetical protein Cri9333_2368 [Crinalium epipsammum PCC 9333]|uniref:Uncharacterized protein n=1 Tax=Crinalium epipsammum PCC 9333 TaxID=1173022 RepID=K9W1C3_9CYAN|nr:hypothetical protein Cri9333_2368 [Crinalium epipsammum PCC 9333]